ELEVLLAGCKDAPDEDEPRQILADWLEEHGEGERAEFVRLQLRLSPDDWVEVPWRFAGPDPDEWGVGGRGGGVGRRRGAEGLGWLPESGLDGRFRRGLVAVGARRGQASRLAGALGGGPWLETLCLDPADSADLREVIASGWLSPF